VGDPDRNFDSDLDPDLIFLALSVSDSGAFEVFSDAKKGYSTVK
jgi:hypothetical protein